MATIRPFRGLRYSASELDGLVAPPYDVISPSEREAFAQGNPHNIVLLTMPEQNPDDRSQFVKYARSSARLQQWKDDGTMAIEAVPTLYRYTQHFKTPYGEALTRVAVIALIKVEPYSAGVVLPHEQTFPKHKEDRLRILEATRSHLECIFGLYADPGRAIFDMLATADADRLEQVTTDDGVEHLVDGLTDPETVAQFVQFMSDKKVWIADGHHRYETALNYRGQLGEKSELIPEDFMMMALSSMEDPGLVLLPTHRILKQDPGDLRAKLTCDLWEISEAPNDSLMTEIERIGESGTHAFGVALPGGTGLILKITDLDKVLASIPGDASRELKSLDVTILHEVIFAQCLGLSGLDFFGYTRDPKEALDAVEQGSAGSFLMNPPTVHDMRLIANGGEKMPQKSTYYYPKILSGLVLWRFDDF